jgi:hypothetical protein
MLGSAESCREGGLLLSSSYRCVAKRGIFFFFREGGGCGPGNTVSQARIPPGRHGLVLTAERKNVLRIGFGR